MITIPQHKFLYTKINSIKAIIFDLGGVIIDIDYHLTRKSFEALGAKNFHKLYSQTHQSLLFNEFETGNIDSQTFRLRLKEMTKLPLITNAQIDNAWNAMLLNLPKERLDFIATLRKNGYKTFLFSNTNEIHLKRVFDICKKMTGHQNFNKIFDKEYYSHLCHFRKPNPKSFENILKDNSLYADAVLFIDDSLQHIKGAQQVGIHTHYLNKGDSITNLEGSLWITGT